MLQQKSLSPRSWLFHKGGKSSFYRNKLQRLDNSIVYTVVVCKRDMQFFDIVQI